MDCSVSIIIPVYNVESYILMCLQSVANQTLTEGLECILIDDCGIDNSVQLAKEFIDSYTGEINFSLIHMDKNGGLSAARNIGIEAATKEYLFFLDSDDEITPDCIELMWGLIEKYGKVDLVQGSFYENETDTHTLSRYKFSDYSSDRRKIKQFLLLYAGDIIPAQSRLVKKDVILKNSLFFKEGIIHEDNYWTFFLAKHITTMCFSNVRTYYHRYNPNSITGNVNRDKERLAYNTIIKDLCKSLDPFLAGTQKEYIINNYITAVNERFFEHEIDSLRNCIYNTLNVLEKFLFYLYVSTQEEVMKTKILHALFRVVKFTSN